LSIHALPLFANVFKGTGEVEAHRFSYGGINFTICDTPGFDDCSHSDTEILRGISN
jgi:predicted GTPase